MYCITSSPNFITNFAFNSENVGDENLNTYLLNLSLIFEITTPTVLLKFKTTEIKSVIENLPFIKETDYDRKAENTLLAVIIYGYFVFLTAPPGHSLESRIIKRLSLSVTSEVPSVESDRYFMSTSRALSPVPARAVSLSSCAAEVCYSTLTTVSPVLAVSHLMTGSVTLEWKLLMKKTLGHITPLKFSSGWIMQMSLTR